MGTDYDPDDLDLGVAGASARREHARRRANRVRRTREKHPRLSGVILALQKDPGHEQAWATGAEGEERVAKSLAKHVRAGVWLLHDRGIPGSRANIDHIAIGASGVWVIDAKRYTGKAQINKPLLGEAKLLINGRERSALIDGLTRQVQLVATSLARISPEVPIHAALCFVDTKLPMWGTLTFKGVPLLYPRRLAKRINAAGPLSPEGVAAVQRTLASAFPSA